MSVSNETLFKEIDRENLNTRVVKKGISASEMLKLSLSEYNFLKTYSGGLSKKIQYCFMRHLSAIIFLHAIVVIFCTFAFSVSKWVMFDNIPLYIGSIILQASLLTFALTVNVPIYEQRGITYYGKEFMQNFTIGSGWQPLTFPFSLIVETIPGEIIVKCGFGSTGKPVEIDNKSYITYKVTAPFSISFTLIPGSRDGNMLRRFNENTFKDTVNGLASDIIRGCVCNEISVDESVIVDSIHAEVYYQSKYGIIARYAADFGYAVSSEIMPVSGDIDVELDADDNARQQIVNDREQKINMLLQVYSNIREKYGEDFPEWKLRLLLRGADIDVEEARKNITQFETNAKNLQYVGQSMFGHDHEDGAN